MLGLDVTLRTSATAAVQQRMADLGPLGHELLLPALAQYRSLREPAGPPVHDVCAVAWVAAPELFTLVPARVQVEMAGQLTAGMTVTDFELPASSTAVTRWSRWTSTSRSSGTSRSGPTPGWPPQWAAARSAPSPSSSSSYRCTVSSAASTRSA